MAERQREDRQTWSPVTGGGPLPHHREGGRVAGIVAGRQTGMEMPGATKMGRWSPEGEGTRASGRAVRTPRGRRVGKAPSIRKVAASVRRGERLLGRRG